MLEIKEVTKLFSENVGIDNFSGKFEPGKITGIIGNNGSGKSTLVKCIFKEYIADKIDATFNGESLTNRKVLPQISLLPDQSVYPSGVTVFNFLWYKASLFGYSYKEAKQKVEEYLELVSLTSSKNKMFHKLSAGMQKRAMLALCLLNSPKFLFLDEPTANMDISAKKDVILLIKKLADKGIGVVVITHELEDWGPALDHLIVIQKSKKVFDEPMDKTKNIVEIFDRFDDAKHLINTEKIEKNF